MDNNQLDLGRIYGLTGCPEGGCVYTGEIIPNIPSLEQIAAVNYAQQYLSPRYATPELQQGVAELEQTLEAARQQAGAAASCAGTGKHQRSGPAIGWYEFNRHGLHIAAYGYRHDAGNDARNDFKRCGKRGCRNGSGGYAGRHKRLGAYY